MNNLLRDKVVVVTGAAGGIGAASAEYFAEQGAAVVLTDLKPGPLDPVAARIADKGHTAETIAADLCVDDQVASLFDQVHKRYGRIDGLMCCAGIGSQQVVLDTDARAFDRIMQVNVTAVYACCRHAYRLMKDRRGGSLVLVASRLAQAACANVVPYIASKGAIVSMTRAMAVDFGADGVRVNAVLPGATETPMLRREIEESADPAATRRTYERSTILGGLAQPLDIASAAGFLLSDAARFITGTGLTVDGGCLAHVYEGPAGAGKPSV